MPCQEASMCTCRCKSRYTRTCMGEERLTNLSMRILMHIPSPMPLRRTMFYFRRAPKVLRTASRRHRLCRGTLPKGRVLDAPDFGQPLLGTSAPLSRLASCGPTRQRAPPTVWFLGALACRAAAACGKTAWCGWLALGWLRSEPGPEGIQSGQVLRRARHTACARSPPNQWSIMRARRPGCARRAHR